MRYTTEKEIAEVIRSFEDATIARTDWRHLEHLIVANHYLSENDFETAYEKMRGGIFKLLVAFGVDLSKEMPYHETLTVFWLKTVDEFRQTATDCSLVEMCAKLEETFDKDYPLKFYSRERLFSEEARAKFIVGDLQD